MSLSSVWSGNDAGLLVQMIPLYCKDPKLIVDATAGGRTMWKGVQWEVTFCDADPEKNPDIVTCWTELSNHVADVDLLVFDPPHWPTSSKGEGRKFNERYGLKDRGGSRAIIDLFTPFLEEASRVLQPKGVVFAKICDLVNGRKSRWQHVEFINQAEKCGFTVCDLIVKVRTSPGPESSTWKNQIHARKRHSYWIVLRKGKSCQ